MRGLVTLKTTLVVNSSALATCTMGVLTLAVEDAHLMFVVATAGDLGYGNRHFDPGELRWRESHCKRA